MKRLKQLSTLKYRDLRGNMTEVFKFVHNYYDSEDAVKLYFNTLSRTRGYRLQKFTCHYNFRKYSFVLESLIFGTANKRRWYNN